MGTDPAKELTICDIMGDWGTYQWSLTLFALLYSALTSMTVVAGPIWTPELRHVCAPDNLNVSSAMNINFTNNQYECIGNLQLSSSNIGNLSEDLECTNFIYDDENYGKVLTNTFDLVCSRKWLKSFISSSALIGMLISSVTLGLISDKCGRMSCIRWGFLISILATVGAILSYNYLLLNVCVMLMCFGQIGAANALSTLVMESTSPRWRFVSVFEYGLGWGLGILLTPILNELTMNYKYFLSVMLLCQLVMLIWLRWGVFESIRWLVSEGKVSEAQIELQRACRINGINNGAKLAQKIAQIQDQEMRKASCVIENKTAPTKLAQAMQQNIDISTQELDVLGKAIRRSFALDNDCSEQKLVSSANANQHAQSNGRLSNGELNDTLTEIYLPVLSPTLARNSFSLTDDNQQQQQQTETNFFGASQTVPSITNRTLAELALKYSKTLQQQEEGEFFIVRMFHKKLYKMAIVLILLSILLETAYYGFIQANKFVGSNVNINYIVSALGEWLADAIFMLVLWVCSRRVALITPTLICSLACLGIALTYHLIPDIKQDNEFRLDVNKANITGFMDQIDSLVLDDHISTQNLINESRQTQKELIELRQIINFWIMNIGKLSTTVATLIAFTIAMETYPNNLRQSGSNTIMLFGRIGSILAPFLFNDNSLDKHVLKITLIVLCSFGFIVCIMVPFFVRDNKDKELCDRLNQIEDN